MIVIVGHALRHIRQRAHRYTIASGGWRGLVRRGRGFGGNKSRKPAFSGFSISFAHPGA
jgi:hypothetical protein